MASNQNKQGMIKIVIMPNLQHLMIKRKSKMEWISVEDRLPATEGEMIKSGDNYLDISVICFDGQFVYADDFQAGNTKEFWGSFAESNPTHWMPLPPPPKLK